MSTSYRAVLRLFGTPGSLAAARKAIFSCEADEPSREFSVEPLGVHSHRHDMAGLVFRGARQRQEPAWSQLDFVRSTVSVHPDMVSELLVERDDCQTLTTFFGGETIYSAQREEDVGDRWIPHPLGHPGLKYIYSREEGTKNALLTAIEAADMSHTVHAL